MNEVEIMEDYTENVSGNGNSYNADTYKPHWSEAAVQSSVFDCSERARNCFL